MSVSRHPVALRLEQRVGSATKLLATVMVLPLVDGIFPALVVAGVLTTATGVIETGILIFGGSATAAVILAEMDGSRRQMAGSVLLIGAIIIPLAALEAAFAPTFREFLNLLVFERFAGLVILTIAAKTASSEIGEYLPSPGVIISLGLVASFEPSGFALRNPRSTCSTAPPRPVSVSRSRWRSRCCRRISAGAWTSIGSGSARPSRWAYSHCRSCSVPSISCRPKRPSRWRYSA